MNTQSLWLGSFRQPMRKIMIGFITLTALMFGVILVSNLFSEEFLGVHEMIRPEGRPMVAIMLFLLAGTMLSASLYLSDTVESIEGHPQGFFDILSLVVSRAAMVLTALTVLVMFYEVVLRYLFSAPTLWANELSLWMASFIFLFAGQYAMQQRSHIRIYVIYDLMPRWMQKTSDVISCFLIVFFAFALVWGNYADAMRRWLRMETFGTAWDPPIPGVVKPAILIIIVLVAIQAISNLIADWNKAPESHSPMDDIDQEEIESIRRTLEK
ncbi:MAG: TRAP transporter small permease [Oceanospirillaceae bacterium]|nr:TRAP transporter small permease [Oceanospirillaceae bacterium]